MRKFLKILSGLFLAIGLIIGLAFYFTQGIADQAEAFFLATKSGDVDSVYKLTSSDFKATTSKDELDSYIQATNLDKFVSASWSSRKISGDAGTVSGTVTTTAGNFEMTLRFIKESSLWKLQSISKPPSGLIKDQSQSIRASKELPSEAQQVDLVMQSMSHFADSVAVKDMSGFREHISSLWRSQFSLAALDEAYSSIYEAGSSLQVLNTVPPQFDKLTTLDENGVMTIIGHYPGKPDQAYFTFKYIYEGTGWKMLGLHIQIK